MNHLELKYARLLLPYLLLGKELSDWRFNFRCPYCGDSKKDENKKRGWLFEYDSHLYFKCFNCGQSKPFKKFLKEINNPLYMDMRLELLKGEKANRENKRKRVKRDSSKKIVPSSILQRVEVNADAVKYLKGRGFPVSRLKYVWYSENIKAATNKVIPGKFKNDKKCLPSIVFPICTSDGEMVGFSARFIGANKGDFRYLTIRFKNDNPYLYGMDFVSRDKMVFIVEGAIDSHFLDNAVAMCGASLNFKPVFREYAFCNDCEPRNKEIVAINERLLKAGHPVVLLPHKYSGMDINDIHLNTSENVNELLRKHVVSGMAGLLKLKTWKRV